MSKRYDGYCMTCKKFIPPYSMQENMLSGALELVFKCHNQVAHARVTSIERMADSGVTFQIFKTPHRTPIRKYRRSRCHAMTAGPK